MAAILIDKASNTMRIKDFDKPNLVKIRNGDFVLLLGSSQFPLMPQLP